MIKVYHCDLQKIGQQDHDLPAVLLSGMAPNFTEIVTKLWKQGDIYQAVAEVDSTNLEFAFRWTNSLDTSWSQETNDRVKVLVPLHSSNGQVYGLRSSSVGDVFERDGELFVVAFTGFTKIAI